MAIAAPQNAEELSALRAQIDEIDTEMHRLLMRRGEVIDRLVAVKRTQDSGVAFRPGREAEMLRRLADRHHGTLPLATVEHVWREIIGTFTQAQAPFKVHAPHASRFEVRDTLRFHFGFSAEIADHETAEGAIAASAASGTDLTVIPLSREAGEAWWLPLTAPDAGVKIVTALPLLVPAHKLGFPPVLVIGSSQIEIDDAPVAVYAAEGPVDDPHLTVLARSGDRSLVAYEDKAALAEMRDDDALQTALATAVPVGRLYALPKF